MEKLHPPVLWGQDRDKVYLTVELGDIKKHDVKFVETALEFVGVGGHDQKEYAFTLNLAQEVIQEDILIRPGSRNLVITLKKKESGNWPKIYKEAKKPHWLKTDFSRFKDSDESDNEEPEGGDFSNVMNQLGSFEQPEAPEDYPEEEDSDDDLPDLTDS